MEKFTREQVEALEKAWANTFAPPHCSLPTFKRNLGIKEAVNVRPGDVVKNKDGSTVVILSESAVRKMGYGGFTTAFDGCCVWVTFPVDADRGHFRRDCFTDLDGNPIERVEY